MRVAAGQAFTTSLVDPAGDVGNLGARIEVPVSRAIVDYWRPGVLVGSLWTVTLEAPDGAGDYLVVWRDGDHDPPLFEAYIPITTVIGMASSVVDYPPVTDDDVRPTVDDVAQLERTRTIDPGSNDVGMFGDSTSPTYQQVEEIIEQALDDVMSELPVPEINPQHYRRIKRAVTLQSAILIEGSYHREQAGDASVKLWQQLYNQAVTGLRERIQRDLDQKNLVRGFEPLPGQLA